MATAVAPRTSACALTFDNPSSHAPPQLDADAIARVANGTLSSVTLKMRATYQVPMRCTYEVAQQLPRSAMFDKPKAVVAAPRCGTVDDPAKPMYMCTCPIIPNAVPEVTKENVNVQVSEHAGIS